jgi:hypothetical protein
MTEEERLTCEDPALMADFADLWRCERKLRLFGSACVRRVWQDLPEDALRQAVEVCERYADRQATAEELAAARELADGVYRGVGDIVADHSAIAITYLCEPKPWFPMGEGYASGIAAVEAEARFDDETPFHIAKDRARQAHCGFIRDLINNPFRPARFSLSYRTPGVLALANATYDYRNLPSGHLDPTRLFVLGDTLEEAGCTDTMILSHLRGPGPHVRGCWVLDLILGKQ